MDEIIKKTDLDSVKDIALSLLYIEIQETELSPMIILHPIFESAFLYDNKNNQIINVLEDTEGLNNIINQYDKRIKSSDSISSIYCIIRKSYRLTFLKFIENYLSIKDFSDLLSDAWTTSENPNQDVNVSISNLTRMFKKANKKILMSKEEYQVYINLPECFTVYRGVAVDRNPDGLSWTRNYKTAKWFANRFNVDDKKGYIQQGTAYKKDVLAYFNRRDEDEIVITIKELQDVKIL